MKKRAFESELQGGHKGPAVIVPFDPEEEWGLAPEMVTSDYGRWPGHLVKGRLNGEPFEGWISSAAPRRSPSGTRWRSSSSRGRGPPREPHPRRPGAARGRHLPADLPHERPRRETEAVATPRSMRIAARSKIAASPSR